MLALDETRLITLERACLIRPGAVRNTARIYLADTSGAEDVSPQGRASGSARPVSKRLLVDFNDLIQRWPRELANLDNFEALASWFGTRPFACMVATRYERFVPTFTSTARSASSYRTEGRR